MSIVFISWVVFLLYIIYDTDAIKEYLSLFNIKYYKEKEFKESKDSGQPWDYSTFLLLKYNCFLVRLLTCPICVAVWLNIAVLIFIDFKYFAGSVILSWVGYFGLRKALTYLA